MKPALCKAFLTSGILALMAPFLHSCQNGDFAGTSGNVDGNGEGEDGNGPASDGGGGQKGGKKGGQGGQGGADGGLSDDQDGSGNKDDILKELAEELGQKEEDGLTVDGDKVEKCSTPPKTKVQLLTAKVQNGTPGNHIDYGIYVEDCNGKKLPVSAEFIHFDIDAFIDGADETLGYSIISATGTIDGTLTVVDGVDLFGNTGENYFHNKTDQTVSTDEPGRVVRLKIDLRGETFHPPGGNDAGPQETYKTYLRFGETTPVRQDVDFVMP